MAAQAEFYFGRPQYRVEAADEQKKKHADCSSSYTSVPQSISSRSSVMKIEAVRCLVTSAAGKEIDLGRHSGGDGSWRGTMLNNAAVTAAVVPRQMPPDLL